MNLVGKIFIVLIFLMSLVFMTISVAVYSAHTNWREVVENTDPTKPRGLKHQLADAIADTEALMNRIEALDQSAKAELEQRQERLNQLESANGELREDLDEKDAALAEAKKEVTSATNTMNRVAARLEDLKTELEDKRAKIRDVTDEKDKNRMEVVRLTDVVNQLVNEGRRLEGIQMAMAMDVIRMEKLLKANDINPLSDPSSKPPKADGVVSKPPTKEGLVEVTLGEDDGLRTPGVAP